MHETRTQDGRIIRQFVQERSLQALESKLSQLHAEAIRNPDIKSIYQVKIGRNDPCPCGSGKKFKKCCVAPVNR